MTSLRLDSIDSIGHVQIRVRDIDNEVDLFQEVYTGSVKVGFSNNGDHVARNRFEVFLPVANNTIKDYDSDQFQAAAMVSLAGVQATEDEEFVGVIDSFQVGLISTSSGGAIQNLVLIFDLGVLNGTIHRVAYNVTVAISGSFSDRQDVPGSLSPP